jgi:hypothetical protein
MHARRRFEISRALDSSPDRNRKPRLAQKTLLLEPAGCPPKGHLFFLRIAFGVQEFPEQRMISAPAGCSDWGTKR